MADIPKYGDFAKSYTDLVAAEDFPAGTVSVKLNTVTSNKVKFTVNASQGTAADAPITGDIKAKATVRDVTFTETFALPKGKTGATLRFQTEYKNLFTRGVKLEADTKIPIGDAAATTFEATLGYASPSANVSARIVPSAKIAEVSAVAGANHVTVGASATLKLDKTTLAKASAAASYTAVDFDVTAQATHTDDDTAIDAYVTQDVFKNRSLLLGVRAGYKIRAKTTGFEVATAYRLDSASLVRAKAQLDGSVGVSLTHQLREDLKVTVGANTDTKLSKSTVGVSLTFGN